MTAPSQTGPGVALFASSYAPHLGGVEELCHRLAREQRRRGRDTVVITNRYPSDLPAEEQIDSIPVRRVRFRVPEPRLRHLGGWAIGTRQARVEVMSALRQHRPDVIHVQCVSSNAYYALRAARRSGLPLVVSMQGELTMDASAAYQRSAMLRRLWRTVLTEADVVTGCSQQVVDEALDVLHAPLRAPARVVPNGVDVHEISAVEPQRRERPYVFAFGRHVPQKGFDVLVDAFAAIAGTQPELDLVIGGDGPERAALEQRVRDLGLDARIHLPGRLEHHDAIAHLRGAAAFVLPSRHEPQGIVVAEAMASETPVIATRVGGVPETIRDGENGLLVPPADPRALADAISEVVRDPDAAQRRVARAASDVEALDWTRIADRYDDCYAEAKARR